jgi:hypothetical protein
MGAIEVGGEVRAYSRPVDLRYSYSYRNDRLVEIREGFEAIAVWNYKGIGRVQL